MDVTDQRMLTYHGAGYVGLTGAVTFAEAGWQVTLYDPDQAVIDAINAGKPRAGDFLAYLDADVAQLVADGRLIATSRWDAAVWSPVHVIAVPTERNGEPYDEIVLRVLRRLIEDCAPETTVLIESTLTPGTIDKLMLDYASLGSLHVAVCPRRDWFADRTKNLGNLHRVVGGVTPACTAKALDIYATVTPRELLQPTDYRTAELVKALENALLHIPVMFCHQLASALPEHNVAEAMRLASTHWRLASIGPFYLGLGGSGGRCVPLGTRYLVEAAAREVARPPTQRSPFSGGGNPLTIGEQAIEADQVMAEDVASVVDHAAGPAQGQRSVVVLGIAYRPGFKDAGRSPGLRVAKELVARGLTVSIDDPLWTSTELTKLTGLPVAMGTLPLPVFDAVLLATPHEEYRDWPMCADLWRPGQLVLDGQGAWAAHRERFTVMGVDYRQVGEAGWMRTSSV